MGGERPHFIVEIGDHRIIKGVTGMMRRGMTKGVMGNGHIVGTDFLQDLGWMAFHPLTAAPQVYYYFLGAVVGGGRWMRRGERALAVAAPARGPLHPWTPAAMAIARTIWTVEVWKLRPKARASAAERPPVPAAKPRMKNMAITEEAQIVTGALTVVAKRA